MKDSVRKYLFIAASAAISAGDILHRTYEGARGSWLTALERARLADEVDQLTATVLTLDSERAALLGEIERRRRTAEDAADAAVFGSEAGVVHEAVANALRGVEQWARKRGAER